MSNQDKQYLKPDLGTLVTPEDWSKVLAVNMPKSRKKVLQAIFDNSNSLDWTAYTSGSRWFASIALVNLSLKEAGLNFRVYNSNRCGHWRGPNAKSQKESYYLLAHCK